MMRSRVREVYIPRKIGITTSKAKRTNTPKEGSLGRTNAPSHTHSFLSTANKRCSIEQRRLRRDGSPARRVVVGSTPRIMTTLPKDNSVERISFTLFTLPFLVEVNRLIAVLQVIFAILFTSFTSFSRERIMWARACERERARINASPIRMTSEQSEQASPTPEQYSDYAVHSASSTKVNGGVAL